MKTVRIQRRCTLWRTLGASSALMLVLITSACSLSTPVKSESSTSNLDSYELREYGSTLVRAYLKRPSGLERIIDRWGEPTEIISAPLDEDSVDFMIGDQEWSYCYGWDEDGTAVVLYGGNEDVDMREMSSSGRELLERVEYGSTTVDELSRMLERFTDCEWEPFQLLTPERTRTETVYQWHLRDGSGFVISLGVDLRSQSRSELNPNLFGVYYWGADGQADPDVLAPNGF